MNEPERRERPDSGHQLPERIPVARVAVQPRRNLSTRPFPPIDQSEGLSTAFIVSVFRKWWKLTIPVGLVLACCAGALVLWLHVPKYEAKALISIEAATPYIAFQDEGNTQRSDRYVETQIELLRSPVVLGPVVGRPEIARVNEFKGVNDPMDHLASRLTIKQVGKSELYDIRYVSSSPKDASSVVNAVVTEYLNLQSDEDFRRSQRVIEVLEEERLRRSDEVDRLRKRVVELAEEVTGRDPFGQGAVTNVDRALTPVSSLYSSLTEVDVKREVLKAEIRALRESPVLIADHAEASGMIDGEIAIHPEVLSLNARIDEAQAKMQEIKDKSLKWETHPGYLLLKTTSQKLEAELSKLTALLRKQKLEIRSADRAQEHERIMAEKEQELASLDTQEKLFSSKFAEQLELLKDGGAQSVQLEFARAELAREESVFELIAARKLALQTELRAPARVALRQPAVIPPIALEPVPYKLLAIACLGAMVCPLGLAVVREVTVKKISSVDQLLQESQVRILGEVARFPVRPVASEPRQLSGRAQQEMFIFAESIDSVRTSLMLSEALSSHGDNCVLAVSSASSGEGKTSVATSLAISFAGATKKATLLIDADLRSPDAAAVLGVPASPGLAELLASRVTVKEAIHRIGETNTYVLPAGRVKGNPHHLVQPAKIDRLLESLRKEFSCIIIDTPPILSASESLVYAKAADFVVYCSLRDVSRAAQVRTAIGRLQDAGANLAGSVLSGMPCNKYAYHYGVYGHDHT